MQVAVDTVDELGKATVDTAIELEQGSDTYL